MVDYYLDLAKTNGADGIDFIAMDDGFWSRNPLKYTIVASYTIEQLSSHIIIPKTPHFLWKMMNGEKYYLDERTVL